MFVIGITGVIGSGKSSLSTLFVKNGALLIDADRLSHDLCENDENTINKIKALLGDEVYGLNNEYLRSKVAAKVFKDKALLDKLSLIIHQELIKKTILILDEAKKEKRQVVILDFPLPIKEGFLDKIQHLIVVNCNEQIRIERLLNKGFNIEEIKRRLAVQMSPEQYKKLADTVIENSGDIVLLEENFKKFVKKQLWPRGIMIQLED